MLQSTVEGLDSNIILSSSVPSREAVNLGYLRYTQNRSTPGRIQGENKFGGWGVFWLCFCCPPRKGKDYVCINNLEHISWVLLPMFTLVCRIIIMQRADLASTEAFAISVSDAHFFFCYQRHHFTKKKKLSCNSVLEKYIKNFAAPTT